MPRWLREKRERGIIERKEGMKKKTKKRIQDEKR